MSKSKINIISGPVKGVFFYNINKVVSEKYPDFFFLRNEKPNFAIGQLSMQTQSFPAIASVKLLKQLKQPHNKYTPIIWSTPKDVFENYLLRVEVLAPKRDIVDEQKLPYLVVASYEARDRVHPDDCKYRYLESIQGKHKLILKGFKATRTYYNATDILVMLAWEPVILSFNVCYTKSKWWTHWKVETLTIPVPTNSN